MQVTFNLDYYFKKTHVYYALFDGLFNKIEKDKLTVLKELGIGSSSYRNQRAMENVSNKSNISLLLDYFQYKMNYPEDQQKYEILLTKIYYCCYYKQLTKIKTLLKGYLLGSGLKLDNAMIVRIFNIVKEIVNDMKDLSNKDKDTLQEIKGKTNIACTDLLQFVLILERYLLGLQDDFDLDLNEVVLGAIQEYLEE